MTTEQMNKGNEWRNYLLIAVIGFLFFIPYLGKVHLFDWDEINFAEAAREMIVTGDYLTVSIDFQPFHEKPPLFFWLQAASMKVFGINEFAARLPNALIGILTLMILYAIGKKLFDYRLGFLWVVAYLGSFLPHFYFRTGLIDPTFNLLMFMGIYFISERFYQAIYFGQASKHSTKCTVLAGLFVSLAILTKGPVGYLLPALSWVIMWILNRSNARSNIFSFLMFTAIALTPTILWYALILLPKSNGIVADFIAYQIRLMTTSDAGHGGPFYYHFVVLLAGCFPASILLLRGLRRQQADSSYQQNFRQWMIVLLCVVLVIFSIVKTKIVHYSSLTYFPITFFAAYAMYSIAYRNLKWKASTNWLLGIFGLLWALVFIAIPLLLINADMIMPRITDEFTRGILQAKIRWNGMEYLVGVFYLACLAVSIIMLARHSFLKGFFTLFGSTAIAIFMFLPVVVPKVDAYMQSAPLEFYGSLRGCDCYVQPLGYKSFAHYFYSGRRPFQSPFTRKVSSEVFETWLLEGKIDRPAYFITKNKSAKNYLKYADVRFLYSRNGYVFMKRDTCR